MPVADMTDAIDLLGTGSYTVVRTADNVITNGYLTAGTTSTFTITASVQPMGGKGNKRESEGIRTEETLVLFTPTELRAADGSAVVADQINVRGKNFTVVKVEDFVALGNYWRVTATRSLV